MLSPVCLGKVAVATAGTPVHVAATQTPCSRITFFAPPGNTGNLFVGNSAVSESTGAGTIAELAKGTSITIESQDGANRLNAADYWLDVATNADACYVSYWAGA